MPHLDDLPAVRQAWQESAHLDASGKMGAPLNKTDVLLMAMRAALLAMVQAIEVYLDMPVSNRRQRRL